MVLIVLILLLVGLKFFDIGFMKAISWWWITGLFFVSFIWFEYVERLFGFDKKRLHQKGDEIQKRRAKKIFEKK